jgi:hypothetical protein
MASRAKLSLGRRLGRLEARRPVGYATCRRWGGVLVVGDDGPVRPARCPECGRVVCTLTRVYVGVNLSKV